MKNDRLLLVIGAALVLAPPGPGFWVVFQPHTHKSITLDALQDFNFTLCPASKIADYVSDVDNDENTMYDANGTFMPPMPNAFYKGEHHFDRKPNQDHVTAFVEGVKYFRSAESAAEQAFQSGGYEIAMMFLGQALHSIQDFIAHSNLVDELDTTQQTAAINAVLTGTGNMPGSLRLMYYDPLNPKAHDSDDPIDTKGGYTHEDHAKDFGISPFHKANPFHGLASDMARDVSKALVAQIVNKVGTAFCGCAASAPISSRVSNNSGPATCTVPNGLSITPVTSLDPNTKLGSQGVGTQQFVAGAQATRYSIYFENQPTASAPAQAITITDPLSPNVDGSTLTLGPITFPNQVVNPPAIPLSLAPFTSTVDLRPTTNLLVKINAALNASTGTLTWTFQSLDPATNQPPADPLAGFLPPGTEGSVFFTVMPKPSVTTGTVISNTATVIFDANPPINTPTWSNTIDNTAPTSKVSALPSTETSPTFTVQWSGTDVGSGIQDFTIYVSDNGTPFTAWLTNTPSTQATYTGVAGHTYGFYSIARDLVGNIESSKTAAEATTSITQPMITLSPITLNPGGGAVLPVSVSSPSASAVVVTLTSSDPSVVSLSTASSTTTANVLIPAGTTSTSLRVVGGKAGVATITATATGYSPANLIVQVGTTGGTLTIVATIGTPQRTATNAQFANPLTVTVTNGTNPVAGATVIFTAPAVGPSATFAGGGTTATAITSASGVATSPLLTANAIPGSYQVVASVPGAGTPAAFALTNVGGSAIILSPITLHPGDTPAFPVSLSSPVGDTVVVTLTTSDPAIVSLSTASSAATANVLIPAGQTTSNQLRVAAGKPGTATITATANGFAPATVQLPVVP